MKKGEMSHTDDTGKKCDMCVDKNKLYTFKRRPTDFFRHFIVLSLHLWYLHFLFCRLKDETLDDVCVMDLMEKLKQTSSLQNLM